MSKVRVCGYYDNTPPGCQGKEGHVRQPLVHVLGMEHGRDVQSITFPPEHGKRIAQMIIEATAAAFKGPSDYDVELRWRNSDDE